MLLIISTFMIHTTTTLEAVKIPRITVHQNRALDLEHFKQMDYFAVNQCELPIELMMENAGLHLATLVADIDIPKDVYQTLGCDELPFHLNRILRIKR